MSGLRTAGFDVVVGFAEGPLADIIMRSPDLGLPISTGVPPNEIPFSTPSGTVGVGMEVQRPSAVTFEGGLPPPTLACPITLYLTRSGRTTTNDLTARLVMFPALNAAGNQAVLRIDPGASGLTGIPSPPTLPPTVTTADFDAVLNGFVLPTLNQRIGDVPLHLPVTLVSPADGTQIERLGAGLTNEGIPAVLVGTRTGAIHAEPAGTLTIPSFLETRDQAGILVRGGWLLQQMILPGLRESFPPPPEITYAVVEDQLQASAPPPIYQSGNFRITQLTAHINRAAGVIHLGGHFRDSGFGWNAEGPFWGTVAFRCEGTELVITGAGVGALPTIDPEWWVVLATVIAGIVAGIGAAIGNAILLIVAAIVFGILASTINLMITGWIDVIGTGRVNTALQPLRDLAELPLPLPTVVDGLVLEGCTLDDAVFTGRLRYRDAAPVRAQGSVLLGRGMLLDLDTGEVFHPGTILLPGTAVPRFDLGIPGGALVPGGQLGGGQESVSVGDLRAFDPARIAVTPEAFDDLTVFELLNLSYVWTYLPPTVGPLGEIFVGGTELAPPDVSGGGPSVPGLRRPAGGLVLTADAGPFQTFAVRTSEGLYSKCRVRDEGGVLRIEYRTYEDVTNAAVGIGGDAIVTDTRRVSPSMVELAFRSTHWVEPVNLTHPLTKTWALAGQTLAVGTAIVTVSGVPVDVEVTESTLVLRTPLGAEINADLGVTVTDATGRTVSATRRVQLPGRRFEVPAPVRPGRPRVTTDAGEFILTVAGAGPDAVRLRLPAGMATTIPRRPTVELRPAVDVLREALARSGYHQKSDYDIL